MFFLNSEKIFVIKICPSSFLFLKRENWFTGLRLSTFVKKPNYAPGYIIKLYKLFVWMSDHKSGFASNLYWGTREAHGNVLSIVLIIINDQERVNGKARSTMGTLGHGRSRSTFKSPSRVNLSGSSLYFTWLYGLD